jgi:hypothetical protein
MYARPDALSERYFIEMGAPWLTHLDEAPAERLRDMVLAHHAVHMLRVKQLARLVGLTTHGIEI